MLTARPLSTRTDRVDGVTRVGLLLPTALCSLVSGGAVLALVLTAGSSLRAESPRTPSFALGVPAPPGAVRVTVLPPAAPRPAEPVNPADPGRPASVAQVRGAGGATVERAVVVTKRRTHAEPSTTKSRTRTAGRVAPSPDPFPTDKVSAGDVDDGGGMAPEPTDLPSTPPPVTSPRPDSSHDGRHHPHHTHKHRDRHRSPRDRSHGEPRRDRSQQHRPDPGHAGDPWRPAPGRVGFPPAPGAGSGWATLA